MAEEKACGGLEDIFNGIVKFCQLVGNAFSAYHNWYIKNADTIEQYMLAFANLGRWYAAVEILADYQIVFTGELSAELITEINTGNNVDNIVENYYFENNAQHMNEMVIQCQSYLQTTAYSELFEQILTAYSATHYHLACIGMFAIVDGVLSDFSENKKTSYRNRVEDIEKKINNRLELNDLDKKTMCIMKTITAFEESIFRNQSFSEDEPADLNRHWVVHGRTRRTYSRWDFLKVLLWLDAIAFLDRKIATK